jgi:hypothetical protein
MKRFHVYLLCQVLGWYAHAAANIVFTALSMPVSWRSVLVYCWGALAAIATTHGLRAYIRRREWLRLSPLRALPRVFVASIVAGAAITVLVTLAWPFAFGFGELRRGAFGWVFPVVVIWSITVFLWEAIYFGVHYFERLQTTEVEKLRLEVSAKDAELRVLLSQVNPHFIFNCLNSLRALIVEDPARAQSMVTELSNILRYTLQSGRTETVPLELELEAVAAYLKLEGIRFEERLQVRMDVDPKSLETRIPPMLLQTLVENGIKHGVARLPRGGQIQVASQVESAAVKIQVRNSGQLVEAGGSTRMGLENARERLRLLYGNTASLVLRNSGTDAVVAEISIPLSPA